MKTLLTLMLATSVAVPVAATAGAVRNPDNDSGTYFDKVAAMSPAASRLSGSLPATGSISNDGLYVWKNPDKGWVALMHSYVYTAGRFEHAPDCLAYNLPKPAPGPAPPVGKGT